MQPATFCTDRLRALACLYCVAQFPIVVLFATPSAMTSCLSGSLGLVGLSALVNGRASVAEIVSLLAGIRRGVWAARIDGNLSAGTDTSGRPSGTGGPAIKLRSRGPGSAR